MAVPMVSDVPGTCGDGECRDTEVLTLINACNTLKIVKVLAKLEGTGYK